MKEEKKRAFLRSCRFEKNVPEGKGGGEVSYVSESLYGKAVDCSSTRAEVKEMRKPPKKTPRHPPKTPPPPQTNFVVVFVFFWGGCGGGGAGFSMFGGLGFFVCLDFFIFL